MSIRLRVDRLERRGGGEELERIMDEILARDWPMNETTGRSHEETMDPATFRRIDEMVEEILDRRPELRADPCRALPATPRERIEP